MEFDWYFRLPDFQNREEWTEVAVLDYYFDPKTRAIREDRAYGTGHKDLVIGMAIKKEHTENPDLVLIEYRSMEGKGPVVLKWLDKSDPSKAGHALKIDGAWRVKAANQELIWWIFYSPIKRRVETVSPELKTVKNIPPPN